MSQNPTIANMVYVTSLETMQGLPLVSLLAGATLLMELPAVEPQKSILFFACDTTIKDAQVGENNGKEKHFPPNTRHGNSS